MEVKKVEIGRFKWDNGRKININSVSEVNDAFMRAIEDFGAIYVDDEKMLQEAINNGLVKMEGKAIVFYDYNF